MMAQLIHLLRSMSPFPRCCSDKLEGEEETRLKFPHKYVENSLVPLTLSLLLVQNKKKLGKLFAGPIIPKLSGPDSGTREYIFHPPSLKFQGETSSVASLPTTTERRERRDIKLASLPWQQATCLFFPSELSVGEL